MKSMLSFGMTAVLALGLSEIAPSAVYAASETAPAIAGHVTSQADGAMEGVVVTARAAGPESAGACSGKTAEPAAGARPLSCALPRSVVSVSVISDAKGDFHFPAARLSPAVTRSPSAPSAMSLPRRPEPMWLRARPRMFP